jgi:hypothetical protein
MQAKSDIADSMLPHRLGMTKDRHQSRRHSPAAVDSSIWRSIRPATSSSASHHLTLTPQSADLSYSGDKVKRAYRRTGCGSPCVGTMKARARYRAAQPAKLKLVG